jgi:hypothetical protein
VVRKITLDSTTDSQEKFLDNNHLPSIFTFPKDGNSWRVDWFGDIAFPNRLLRRTQPSVLVHLSRILDTAFRENPAVLLSPDSTLTSKQRKVWISVGTLPLLSIGDIWRDGQLEMRPDYELEHFTDLEINSDTAVLIKAGLNLEEKGFLLPRSEHPWHMQCTQSYCLMVELPHNRRLIIPCMELIRFYFGSSSNLVTKLFLPPLSRDALYANPHFDKATGHLTLQLAANISGVSAADVGRLHMDPVAWRTAAYVGTSLLKASVSGQGVYPQAYFPFEGRSTLIATGKWLSFKEEPRATFIVYSLRSCSYPFPFRSLRYEVKNRRTPAALNKDGVPSESQMHRVRKSARNSSVQPLVEEDASSKLARQARPVWNTARFPDLTTKTIWKNHLLSAPSVETTFNGSLANEVQHVAAGEPSSERRIRSIDLQVQTRRQSDFPVPEFLRAIVEELKSLEDFRVDLLTQSDQDGWTIPITVLANEDGEIEMRLFVEVGENRLRERRVAVFSLTRGLEHVNIVVIESSPTHIKLYPTLRTSEEDLWEMLRCAATDFTNEHTPPTDENISQTINTLVTIIRKSISE